MNLDKKTGNETKLKNRRQENKNIWSVQEEDNKDGRVTGRHERRHARNKNMLRKRG